MSLEKIVINRTSHGWSITRERKDTGETLSGAANLEEAFDFIRALYNLNGEEHPVIEEETA